MQKLSTVGKVIQVQNNENDKISLATYKKIKGRKVSGSVHFSKPYGDP